MGKYVQLKGRIRRERKEAIIMWAKRNLFLIGLFTILFLGIVYCLTMELLILL